MKQRSDLAEEIDSLLRACWSLAEILFSLRQNRRDGKALDKELLGSAVQACWELCDIFREGWTQIRPDCGTPRQNQINFFAAGLSHGLPEMGSHQSDVFRSNAGSRALLHSKRDSLRGLTELERPRPHPVMPETPVTEFEDTPVSPDAGPQIPNILVLGTSTDSRSDLGRRWSSNASNLSGYRVCTDVSLRKRKCLAGVSLGMQEKQRGHMRVAGNQISSAARSGSRSPSCLCHAPDY